MQGFANYGELKGQIADWLNRADLTDKIPSFVALTHARFNREVRTHDTVKRSTAFTNDGYFTVPTDWRETIALARTSGQFEELEFVNIARSLELRRMYQSTARGLKHYTHVDGKFFLIPAPSAEVDLELIYRASIPVLTADTDTNWLLDRHPDLYLFASLAEAEPYLKNDERVALWQAKANGIFASMQMEAERATYQQGKLAANRRTFG